MSICTITIYTGGQISRQIQKPGFAKSLAFAAKELGRSLETLITHSSDELTVSATHLNTNEWASTIMNDDHCELFGVTVEESK